MKPFRSIPAENDFVPAPVIIATRLCPISVRFLRSHGEMVTHSSGSASYHFQRRSISQHPAMVKAFICFDRLIVTSKTCGAGISRSTCCCSGGGVFVEFGLIAIVKPCSHDLTIPSKLGNPSK